MLEQFHEEEEGRQDGDALAVSNIKDAYIFQDFTRLLEQGQKQIMKKIATTLEG